MEDTVKNIDNKFKSGNSIEVERTQITKTVWEAIKNYLAEQDLEIEDLKAEIRNLERLLDLANEASASYLTHIGNLETELLSAGLDIGD
jgi:excinuclease UvrABC helicase subunit UvrB